MSGRNYKAMGDRKLSECYRLLEHQPAEDRDTIVRLAEQRGLTGDKHHCNGECETLKGCGDECLGPVNDIPRVSELQAKAPLPMLAHTLAAYPDGTPALQELGDDWVMEPKLDGNRLIAHVDDDRQVYLFGGRNGTPWLEASLDPIRDRLSAICPPDTIVDGELMVPMTRASSGDVAHAVASGGQFELWLFDVLKVNGIDSTSYPQHQRRSALSAMGIALEADDMVKLVPYAEPSWLIAQGWLANGLEGVVVKRVDAPYAVGKRSHDMLKWKPQETMEGRIVGFVEGRNGNVGNIGALRIEILESKVKTTVSCPPELSKEILSTMGPAVNDPLTVRAALANVEKTTFGQRWLGRMIEFKHYGLFPSGSPRHPGFVRMRPDRD